ncbi:AT-hook motif nuclear-localized protein 1-like [Alnus glutinosa]|uniref:AT-hook motif nuclear-localized protein 1-like n=1 Tax=Alnus glutinosa TaxID=3517 RepID=UPI002D76F194|nr:AT-hook motif nuclear-localized protein 1-like [Alnus glutinosa]
MGLEGAVKKRKGRPRKFEFDGDRVGLSSSMPESLPKRGPGRPRGSGRRQFLASMGDFAAETAGGDFTPHLFTVHTGEDIVSKISSFFQGPRLVCILAATGVLSSVIIHRPAYGGPTKYDGPFEILSLSGSYTFSETGGVHGRNGSLSILMSRPNGQVCGGGVASALIAGGPIELVVASFKQYISKELKRRHSAKSTAAASIPSASDLVRAPSHISKMTDGDDSGATPTSTFSEPVRGGAVGFFDLNQNMDPPPPRPLHQIPVKRPFPDINASLP